MLVIHCWVDVAARPALIRRSAHCVFVTLCVTWTRISIPSATVSEDILVGPQTFIGQFKGCYLVLRLMYMLEFGSLDVVVGVWVGEGVGEYFSYGVSIYSILTSPSPCLHTTLCLINTSVTYLVTLNL